MEKEVNIPQNIFDNIISFLYDYIKIIKYKKYNKINDYYYYDLITKHKIIFTICIDNGTISYYKEFIEVVENILPRNFLLKNIENIIILLILKIFPNLEILKINEDE